METVALTVWNSIISPVFDAATTFLLVRPDRERETISANGQSPIDVVSLLTAEGVSTVICGAISALPARLLSRNGINVIPWVRGNVEEVLDAYYRGNLDTPLFRMPGCGGAGRGGKGGGHSRRCRRRGNHLKERY